MLFAFQAIHSFQSPDFGARGAINEEEAIEVSHEVHNQSQRFQKAAIPLIATPRLARM
jgi:hypothetical protein